MADKVNDSLKDLGKLIEDADKKVKQLDSDYKQGVNGAIGLLDKVKSKLVEVNNVGLKKIINVKDIEEEAKKIPTIFDRVIEQINQRASQSKDKFAKQLIDANAVGSEAKLAITNAIRELNKFRNPLREVFQGKQENVDVNILSSAARKRFLKQQQELLQSTVITQKDNPQAYAALQRYQQSLLEIIRLQEQLDRTQRKYAANQSAIEGVSRRFNETEQAIAKVRDRWEELNVKRQAGLINEKDFKTNTQKLIDEYDKLIKKRQEFEIKDIGQMSFERERARIEEENRLAAIRRENANSRQRDEINAERMIAQERAKRARETAKADADLNSAVSKQISYQKQLNTLRKEYNTLNAKQNRTSEENAILEQTKNKIKEIIGLSKQLNNEQKGSHNLAKQITDYDRLRQKIHDANKETKEHKASLESMLPTLRRLASAFGVAFSVQGLVQFGKKLIETRGEFELQQVALRSILQNKQLADEIWDKTMQAALQSPFTAMQLTKYTKQLAAYRIETDKLFDTTKRLADVSAGLGVDMQRLILAYGQVKAANYLRASEIRQFTEAGVNVLGELSNYFSETRGQMISTAQVMDMVQKRMVKFEDVEEIFKRLTKEGGIFYNMQYVQSQTVWGQLRKLRDAYDQMQNSIGKANEGVIKDFVSILNSAVQNWRGIAVTLKSIGWGVAIGWMSKYALALSGITAASMKTKRSIVSLRQGIEGFGKALKANLPMLAIGAAVALITRFVESARQMRQVNDEIDEQITTLYGASRQMSDYQSTIEKNNELIKSNGKEITDNKKRQEALNEALNSNSGIYAKLKNEYPQIAEQLKQNANGTIENTDALKAYNEQLEREMTLLAMREQKANIGNLWGAFSDSATEDLQDALKNTTKVQTEIRNLQLRLKTDVAKMYASGNVDERQIALANEFLAIPTEGDMEEALKRANEIRQKYLKEYAQYVKGDFGRGSYRNLGELSVFGNDFDIQGLGHTLEEFRREMVNIGWIGDGENLGKLETDFVGVIENFADFAKSISDEYSGDVLDFVANNSEIIKKAVEGDAENGIEASPEIVKSIGDALIKAGFATTKEMQSVWNNLLNDRIIFTKKNEELNAIDAQIAAEEAKKLRNRNQQLLTDLKKQRDDYIKSHGLDWFAGSNTTSGANQQSPFDDNNKGKKSASKLISLIREMRSEYDKLSKSAYGYAKSEATVRESYKQSVKEILGKAGITDYDFTTNAGMIAALEKVKVYANKLGPEAAAEVEKYIGQLKTEMTINAQVRIREDFGRQMEEAFGNYELTLDLQKLNLPDDVLKDLFDIDAIDTPALRKELDRLYESLKDENGQVAEESFKVYENWLKKIDDSEQKAQRERLKSYSKYLEYQVSERAKIEMEYARKVAEVQAESAFGGENEQLRSRILDGLKREYNEKIAKQDWEDFKGSEMYIQMMEDLTKQGTASLEIMRKKLIEVRDNAENLSPRALKEVINAIEKIDDEFYSRQSPFARIGKYKKEFEEAMAAAEYDNISGVFTDDAAAKEDYENARKLHETYENIIGDKTTLADVTKKLKDITDEYNITGKTEAERIEDAKMQLETYRQTKKRDLRARNELGGRTKDTASAFDLYTGNINTANAAIASLEKYIELTTEYTTLTEKLKGTDYENVSIEELSRLSKEQLDSMGWSEEEQKRLGNIINLWRRYNKAVSDGLAELGDYVSRIGSLYDNITGNLNALGVSTDVLDEQWISAAKTAINSIKTIIDALKEYKDATKEAVDNGKNLLEAGSTGDYIRLALALLKVLIDVAAQIGLINDANYEKQIQQQQLRLDALKDAYARLEKQIERTWDSVSYMQTYEQQVKNIREQISAMEAQMAAERAKKNVDDNALRQYQRDIQDAYDQLDELEQKSIEVFGGIGEEGYRSAAEGFVEAWKSAFLETGDGLQGLQDHFDEFLQDWFVKQATMQGVAKYYEKVFDYINGIVEDGSVPTYQQIENARELADEAAINADEFMRAMAGIFGIGDSGSLSGLAAGIQGMTEEQANILEAYWNSVRMYTASIDMNVARIAEMLGIGGANTNPMLQQMQTIANNTAYIKRIYDLMLPASVNLGQGRGFRNYSV